VTSSEEIRIKIAAVSEKPLERHSELFAEINENLAEQLQEIERA
jgi:hypothetical protein